LTKKQKRGVGAMKNEVGGSESLRIGALVYDMRQEGKTYEQIGDIIGIGRTKCWYHCSAYCSKLGLPFQYQSDCRAREIEDIERAADERRRLSNTPKYNQLNHTPPPGRSALDIERAKPEPTLAELFALKPIAPDAHVDKNGRAYARG